MPTSQLHANPSQPLPGPKVKAATLFNKVPEITVWFWIIKVLCTTVGETASDFLQSPDNGGLGLGIPKTFAIMGTLLAIALVLQMRLNRYRPVSYWVAVVLISIVGTLVTDWLHDDKGVTLVTTTIIFSSVLAAVFGIWYAIERTLSIHSVYKGRREAFYWLVVLATFALGTSAGDLLAEQTGLGYFASVMVVGGAIALIAFARFVLNANAVLTFWMAYILTRPLGGNTGDWISLSDPDLGGLGLGTTATSLIFLGVIAAVVTYLTVTRKDVIEEHGG